MALRGVGTVYLDEAQWAQYLNAFHVFLGLFVALVVVHVLRQAYLGFMRGWRS
jgi:hypothetical protein